MYSQSNRYSWLLTTIIILTTGSLLCSRFQTSSIQHPTAKDDNASVTMIRTNKVVLSLHSSSSDSRNSNSNSNSSNSYRIRYRLVAALKAGLITLALYLANLQDGLSIFSHDLEGEELPKTTKMKTTKMCDLAGSSELPLQKVVLHVISSFDKAPIQDPSTVQRTVGIAKIIYISTLRRIHDRCCWEGTLGLRLMALALQNIQQ